MKHPLLTPLAALALALAATGAAAQDPRHDYPSCDLPAQRNLTGQTGGTITDPLQAHISVRANILQADIGTARKARRISERQAERLWHRVDKVRKDTDRFVRQQGFLSAAERASYDRALDAVALKICR
ncbi:hypothetical protein [Paracidovorax anthurii]|uniref:Spy/CpxP family protein refolding chaperone n=1 Tax=Paracidovorax anthurii TaxID=78229 RepID=A0A328ZKT4_9BURK|nr:hypothetical protein [Paracidovorax anthurii]RAR86479.1 hypothetical protein AX018_100165 [Paracidovorax anthurii]